MRNPLAAAKVALFGVKTYGPMAPEIPLHNQRPAEYVFSRNVAQQMDMIREVSGSSSGQRAGGKPKTVFTQSSGAAARS